MKFCLITLGAVDPPQSSSALPRKSHNCRPAPPLQLTPDEFRLINPNTLTCPVFRSERDAELTKKLYRAAPVLIREAVGMGRAKARS
jgi:hypothetical protein